MTTFVISVKAYLTYLPLKNSCTYTWAYFSIVHLFVPAPLRVRAGLLIPPDYLKKKMQQCALSATLEWFKLMDPRRQGYSNPSINRCMDRLQKSSWVGLTVVFLLQPDLSVTINGALCLPITQAKSGLAESWWAQCKARWGQQSGSHWLQWTVSTVQIFHPSILSGGWNCTPKISQE